MADLKKMKTTEKTLKEIYNLGNPETKEKLENEFPTLFTKPSLLSKAINYLTEEDEEVQKLRKLENLQGIENILAEQKIAVIFKHLNEKWIPNWKNSSENKYFIWWDMSDFSYCSCDSWGSLSFVSARLCLKNRELAESLEDNKEVIDLFKTYMVK